MTQNQSGTLLEMNGLVMIMIMMAKSVMTASKMIKSLITTSGMIMSKVSGDQVSDEHISDN